MNKISKESEEIFYHYILSELQMSGTRSIHIREMKKQSDHFYLTAISTVMGGTIVLLPVQSFMDPFLLLSLAMFLISIFGTQRSIDQVVYWHTGSRERLVRAGLHRYFKQFDPLSFEQLGGEVILDIHAAPRYRTKFGYTPWSKTRMIGNVSTVNGILLAVSVALCMYYVVTHFVGFSEVYEILIIMLITFFIFIFYVYWLARKYERRHYSLRMFQEKILEIYNKPIIFR